MITHLFKITLYDYEHFFFFFPFQRYHIRKEKQNRKIVMTQDILLFCVLFLKWRHPYLSNGMIGYYHIPNITHEFRLILIVMLRNDSLTYKTELIIVTNDENQVHFRLMSSRDWVYRKRISMITASKILGIWNSDFAS